MYFCSNKRYLLKNPFNILWCIGIVYCSLSSKAELLHEKEIVYPKIGPLFRADILSKAIVPSIKSDEINSKKMIEHDTLINAETHLDNTNWIPKEHANKNYFHFIREERGVTPLVPKNTYEIRSSRKRYKRSKGVVLSGTKHRTDYTEEKYKKHDYDFKKKTLFRGNLNQKRVKRSQEHQEKPHTNVDVVLAEGLEEKKMQKTNPITNLRENKPTEDHNKVSRKEYAQKLFQRKVEALFNIDTDKNSSLSEEEVEKSKTLRKQLLSLYVKGKQKQSSPSPYIHNKSIQEGDNKEALSSLQSEDSMTSPYVRMNVDVPLDPIVDLLKEDQDESDDGSKTDIEGRGRRKRLRRILIPLLLAFKLKLALFFPLIFGLFTLIAFKGLWAGMTSLGLVSILALKSLFNGQKIFYEIRAPHHYHYPPSVGHEIQYHHSFPEYWSRRDDSSYKPIGGWSNTGLADEKMDKWIADADNDSNYAVQDNNNNIYNNDNKIKTKSVKSSDDCTKQIKEETSNV